MQYEFSGIRSSGPDPDFSAAGRPPWTVSELTLYIKGLLELDPELGNVRVRGEISNFTRAASGHLYFTLKDAEAAISCVMWRSDAARLGWQPEHGAAAVARGRISVYPPRGNYQLYVDDLRPAGLGDLHALFEELRHRLEAEVSSKRIASFLYLNSPVWWAS